MKPSEPKCGSDHDYFVLKIHEVLDLSFPDFEIVGFEVPIHNRTTYIGSIDLLLANKNPRIIMQGGKEEKWYEQYIIIDFKPALDKITDAVRQLKVYKYNYPKSKIVLCSYTDEINEERKKICESLGVGLFSIDRKKKQQSVLHGRN